MMNITDLKEQKKILQEVIDFLQSPHFAGMHDGITNEQIDHIRWIGGLKKQLQDIDAQINTQGKSSS